MGKKSGSGSGSRMNNPDLISESLEIIFWVKILKFFDANPGSGMEKFRTAILGKSGTLTNKEKATVAK
jgi:hypothetical protein